jgi:hypothetical protein
MLSATDIAHVEATEVVDTASDGPMRRCVVTGKTGKRETFLRFVEAPDGTVVPDIEGKLPGRGLWLTVSRAALEQAVARNAFAKAAKKNLKASPELPAMVEKLLLRRAIESLSLAKRAGVIVAGFTKAKAAIERGGIGLMVEALDASRAERARLGGRDIPTVSVLSAEEMGAALGRENAVHVAVRDGAMAQRLRDDLMRLAAFRTASEDKGE